LRDNPFKVPQEENYVSVWGELLVPESADGLAWYEHRYWGKYAAFTQNQFGEGTVIYLGSLPSPAILKKIIKSIISKAGLDNPCYKYSFPVVIRNGINKAGKEVHYFLNYSAQTEEVIYYFPDGTDLLTTQDIIKNNKIKIDPWDLRIVIED